jgi:hypothetical protein
VTNPIGRIKDVATETLKVPAHVAGAAVGLARSATHKATGVVSSLMEGQGGDGGQGADGGQRADGGQGSGGTGQGPDQSAAQEAAARRAAAEDAVREADIVAAELADQVAEKVRASPDEPVNVTEELGLDPSPVAKRKPRKSAARKPVTSIDAEADPSDVDATPADLAAAAPAAAGEANDGGSDDERPVGQPMS